MRKTALKKLHGSDRHKAIKLIQQNKEYVNFENPNGTVTLLNINKRALKQRSYKKIEYEKVMYDKFIGEMKREQELKNYNEKIAEGE